MSEFEETQKLIRLKRFEQPQDENYVDGFLQEFHRRQRAELLNNSARGLLFERVATYFADFSAMRWAAAGVGACALVMLGLHFRGTSTAAPAGVAKQNVPETQMWVGQVDFPSVDGNVTISNVKPVYSLKGLQPSRVVPINGLETLPVGSGMRPQPDPSQSPEREF